MNINLYNEPLSEIYDTLIEPTLNGDIETICVWDDEYTLHYKRKRPNPSALVNVDDDYSIDRCSYETYKELSSRKESYVSIPNNNDENGKRYQALGDGVIYFLKKIDGNIHPSLKRVNKIIDNKIVNIMSKDINHYNLYRSSGFHHYKKYKNCNGYMGWHTNCNNPKDRYYFVYNTDENSSFMRYIDMNGNMITKQEPKGWSINYFSITDCNNPLWHCVYTNTHRFSFGVSIEY